MVTTYLTGYSQFYATKIFSLSVSLDTFSVQINFADRSQPYDLPINVKGVALFDISCSDVPSNLLYSWTCMIATTSSSALFPCTDTRNLFGISSSNSSLSVPTTYFSQGSTVQLGLIITANNQNVQTSGNFYISNQNTLILDVYCTNPPCTKYNSKDDLYLQADVENDPGSGYSFQWSINFPFTTVQYQNHYYATGDTTSLSGKILVSVSIVSSIYSGSANFTLPLNFPPSNGSISVSPSSGFSFQTNFQISAQYWSDPDLPLSYTYYYQINSTVTPLTPLQPNYYTYTYLPGEKSGLLITLLANVQDIYGAISICNTTTTVVSASKNLTDAISNMNIYLNTLPISDPRTIAQTSQIEDEIGGFQNDLMDLRKNIVSCTGCGSQATCLLGTCTCKDTQSNTIVDCSITQAMIDQTNDINQKLTQTMLYAYNNLTNGNSSSSDSTFLENSILTTLKQMTSNPEFNSPEQVTSKRK